jgi:predicted DNA-binding antitoxin AbrB/MazE fold protein
MRITVESKIEKGWIRLPKNVRLPDGTRIIVKIEPILKTKDKQKIVSELSGAWSDDSTILTIFEELEQGRHYDPGREVTFE